MLTDELLKANETISFLSSLTGQNPNLIRQNLANFEAGSQRGGPPI
jgi:hypothetical protein